jgi:hypothetical protein
MNAGLTLEKLADALSKSANSPLASQTNIASIVDGITGQYDPSSSKRCRLTNFIKSTVGLLYSSKGIRDDAKSETFFKIVYTMVLWKYRSCIELALSYMENGIDTIAPFLSEHESKPLTQTAFVEMIRNPSLFAVNEEPDMTGYVVRDFASLLGLSPANIGLDKEQDLKTSVKVKKACQIIAEHASLIFSRASSLRRESLLESDTMQEEKRIDMASLYLKRKMEQIDQMSNAAQYNVDLSRYKKMKGFKEQAQAILLSGNAKMQQVSKVPYMVCVLYNLLADVLFKQKYASLAMLGEDYTKQYNDSYKGLILQHGEPVPDDFEAVCQMTRDTLGEKVIMDRPMPVPVSISTKYINEQTRLVDLLLRVFYTLHDMLQEVVLIDRAYSETSNWENPNDPRDIIVSFESSLTEIESLKDDIARLAKSKALSEYRMSFFKLVSDMLPLIGKDQKPDVTGFVSQEIMLEMDYMVAKKKLLSNMSYVLCPGYTDFEVRSLVERAIKSAQEKPLPQERQNAPVRDSLEYTYYDTRDSSEARYKGVQEDLIELHAADPETGALFYESSSYNPRGETIELLCSSTIIDTIERTSKEDDQRETYARYMQQVDEDSTSQIEAKHQVEYSPREYELETLQSALIVYATS